MTAWFGNCVVTKSKWIYVDDYDSTSANYYNQNGIESVDIYPNPNSGTFNVQVSFFKSQRSSFMVQDIYGNIYYVSNHDEAENVNELIQLDSNIISGTYIFKIVAEYDSQALMFIISP